MVRDQALSWRPIERGDVEGWAALIDAVQVADDDREYHGVEGLLDLFRDPYRDFPRGRTAASGPLPAACFATTPSATTGSRPR